MRRWRSRSRICTSPSASRPTGSTRSKSGSCAPSPSRDYRELRALDGVSFEIRQGEFFGIVGRNGSGKSTLLKLLASIYRADAGTIRMAGRLAPFIELGVGFNHDLTARENVVLNGVMMGLTPKEMRDRLDAVIEFAELEEFADLKLKNYSSGMLVRLAFSVMMEADADVLLIDEVLAVGDASFQQKCADAFHEMKAQGQDDRPRHPRDGDGRGLLPPGDADQTTARSSSIGDPAEVGAPVPAAELRDAAPTASSSDGRRRRTAAPPARLLDREQRGRAARPTLEHGEPIRLRAELEMLRDRPRASTIGFVLANADGLGALRVRHPGADRGRQPATLAAGQRVADRGRP